MDSHFSGKPWYTPVIQRIAAFNSQSLRHSLEQVPNTQTLLWTCIVLRDGATNRHHTAIVQHFQHGFLWSQINKHTDTHVFKVRLSFTKTDLWIVFSEKGFCINMKHNMFCFRCIFMFGISAMRVSPNSLSDWEVPWCQVSVRISLICMVYGPNMTQLTKILAKTPKSHRQPAVARVVCHFASDANIILGKETTETTNAPLRGIGLVDWTVLQVQAASRMWRYPTWLLHSWLQADETKKCHFSLYITTNSNSKICAGYVLYNVPPIRHTYPQKKP